MESGPVESWHRWLGRRLDWMLASALVTLALMLAFRQAFSESGAVTWPFTLGMAALPVACLLKRPTVLSMSLLILAGFPCFCSATVYCDIAPDRETGGLLHEVESYLVFVPIYGFLRVLHLGLTKR